MQLLLGGLDEINQDLQKLNMHQRAVYKQQTQIMKHAQERVGFRGDRDGDGDGDGDGDRDNRDIS